MPLSKRIVEAGLRRKGFVHSEGKHHMFRYRALDGRLTEVFTMTGHGSGSGKKDLTDNLIAIMARECGLSRREFMDLVNCPMSQAQFEKILRERPVRDLE